MRGLLPALISVFLCLFLLNPLPAHAAEVQYEDYLGALLDEGGAALLLPDGADPADPETLTEGGISALVPGLTQTAADALRSPLRTLGLLLGVILMASLAEGLRSGGGGVYDCTCVLCAALIAAEPVSEVFRRSAELLSRTSDFMLAFSGIYGMIGALGGEPGAAAVWQGGMAFLCTLALECSTKLLLPLLSMSLALSVADAVSPEELGQLSGFTEFIRKIVTWGLGLVMALFLGMLSVQTAVAAAADRAGTKAAKYVISGAVPIVGGAVSDAYASVLGSMQLLRSGVGMTGMLMVLGLLLPPVLSLGFFRMAAALAAAAAELFGVKPLTKLLHGIESTLAAAFSVSVCFGVIFLFGTAVMMSH